MATKDPAASAAKWLRNIQNAQQSIIDGVNATTISPAAAAVKSKAKMVANFQQAMTNGKYEKSMAGVTLQSWQQAMTQKGIPRIQAGASAAQAKVQAFQQKLASYQQAGISTIKAMPNTTPGDMKARMTAWFDYMSKMPK